MNIKQIFLPLFGALALICCNKEAVEPTSSNTTQANSVTLALSLEGTADASEMRAVSFDANQNVPPTIHEEGISDWTTHCFLRKDDGSKRAYAVITWDATLEGGKVKLKMRGHELNLLPIGSASAELAPENKPVAGERWSIVGITGGGKLNEERTRVDFAPDADLDNNLQPHQARVPFTFEKAYFTVSAASGERAPQIRVHFKPQGSLLNIYANNKTAQTVQSELKVITNALSNNGYYDYSTGEAKWVFTYPDVQGETISRPISVANGTGKHYVLWGMPRTASSTAFKSKVDLADCDISVEGEETTPLQERNGGFDNALAYYTSFDIDRIIWNPLNRLVTSGAPNYFLKVMSSVTNDFVDPTSFTSTSAALQSGIFYTFPDALNSYRFGLNKPYYLPTTLELAAIFPVAGYQYIGTNSGAVTETVQFEGGEDDDKKKQVQSRYKSVGSVIYGLRFFNYDGDSRRTAFRYEWNPNLGQLVDGTPLGGVKITARYVGNDPNYSNDQVYTDDTLWNDTKKTRTVIFFALGDKSNNLGMRGYYWSATLQDVNAENVLFGANAIYLNSASGKLSEMPIILFKR